MVVSPRGDSAAVSTDAVGAPSRMERALSRVRDVLEPVGETLAFVTSVFGIVAGVVEIIRDVCYVVDSARDALDRGDRGGPPSKNDGAVDPAGDASVSAGLDRKLIRTGERSYHGHRKLICKMRRDIPFENLPEDVIRTIFSQLPLQDLIRTSAVSSKWRSMWTICSKLRFDGGTLCGSDTSKTEECTRKFIDNVNTVLQQHEGKFDSHARGQN